MRYINLLTYLFLEKLLSQITRDLRPVNEVYVLRSFVQ